MNMTDELMLSIIGGVIAGLVTTLIIGFVAFVWRKQISPWLANVLYKGLRIDGSWAFVDPNDEYSQHETLELLQSADKLSGKLILVHEDGGTTRTLDINGVIRDGFIVISCTPTNHRNLGFTTIIGQVQGDGRDIVGTTAFYDIGAKKFDHGPVLYRRVR